MGANQDVKFRMRIGVDSVPAGPGVTSFSSSTTANSITNLTVTTYPDSSELSLWNFLYSVYADTNDYAYRYPSGPSTAADAKNAMIYQWLDWADSSDTSNIRVHKIRIDCRDCVNAHNWYFKYKAYTFSVVTGAGS